MHDRYFGSKGGLHLVQRCVVRRQLSQGHAVLVQVRSEGCVALPIRKQSLIKIRSQRDMLPFV